MTKDGPNFGVVFSGEETVVSVTTEGGIKDLLGRTWTKTGRHGIEEIDTLTSYWLLILVEGVHILSKNGLRGIQEEILRVFKGKRREIRVGLLR